jgi:hypothetical protein
LVSLGRSLWGSAVTEQRGDDTSADGCFSLDLSDGGVRAGAQRRLALLDVADDGRPDGVRDGLAFELRDDRQLGVQLVLEPDSISCGSRRPPMRAAPGAP